MEQKDMELIQKFSSKDPMLADLYEQHVKLEKELEKLEDRSYLTVEEQMKRQEIKKRKLIGRDKIESLLRKYRQTGT